MKRLITIWVCSLCLFPFKGKTQVDSLQELLKVAKPDSNKVHLLLDLGDAYQFEKNDLAASKYYYQQAGALSRQLHYSPGIYKYLFYYLDVLVQQSRFDSSLAYSQEALTLASKEKDSGEYIHALYTSAVSYSGMENYNEAIRYFLPVADYYERNKMMDKLAMCDNELMIVLMHTGQFANAIKRGKAAIALYRKYRAPQQVASPLQNLATVYQTMQLPDKAIPLIKEALSISQEYHNDYDELTETTHLVDLDFSMNNYSGRTKAYIDRILFLAYKLSNTENEGVGLYDAGNYFLLQNQPDKAGSYADSALRIALQLNAQDLKQHCYLLLSRIAYSRHNYSNALEYDKRLNLVQEEINTSNINHSMIELQTKYETEKKEAQIKQLSARQQLQQLSLQRKRIYIAIMIIVIAALLIIGLLYSRNYKRSQQLLLAERQLQEQKIVALEQEKQLLATEAVLQGQEEERSRLARDLHDGLGGILSSAKYSLHDMKENMIITQGNAIAFERTMSILDQSISELRRVAHNMMPESLINQSLSDALNDFCNHISSSGMVYIDYHDFGLDRIKIDDSLKVIVYRIIQELVNNIIKHAEANSAIVQIIVKDTVMNITVEDNGKGFDISGLDKAEGIGYRNIKSRIDYLKGKMDIHSQPDKGTSVYIEIPL
jgi:signal transduction histidine kinase